MFHGLSQYSKHHHHLHHPNNKFLTSNLLDYFDHLLQKCTNNTPLLNQLKQTHSQIITTSSNTSLFLASRLISSYSKSDFLDYAKRVFETTTNYGSKYILLGNSILRANVSHQEYGEVLEIYRKMRTFNVLFDGFSFQFLSACTNLGDVYVSGIVHCHVVQMGFQNNVRVGNELLAVNGEVGLVRVARRVFDLMPVRNLISWNIMVSG